MPTTYCIIRIASPHGHWHYRMRQWEYDQCDLAVRNGFSREVVARDLSYDASKAKLAELEHKKEGNDA